MAKVKKEIIEAALLKLIDNVAATMPNSTYKFLLGGATGFLGLSNIGQFDSLIGQFKDENGFVDTCKLRKVYESAFKQAGGKLQIELFNKQDSLLSLFVKPLTLTITQQDIDQLMNEVDQNNVVAEVSLSSN